MIEENILRRIINNSLCDFSFGSLCDYEKYRKVYDARFEAGITWLYNEVLNIPVPKIIYRRNTNNLERYKHRVNNELSQTSVEDSLLKFITREHYPTSSATTTTEEWNKLINEEINRDNCGWRHNPAKWRFDLFHDMKEDFDRIGINGFSLAVFLHEVMIMNAHKAILSHYWHKRECTNRTENQISCYHIEQLKNLCDSGIFHVFFCKDTLYALRYPYFKFYHYGKKSVFSWGSGLNSFETFLPYFYWPNGSKVYASEKQILPNWIFEEYMQDGYYEKFINAKNLHITVGIINMIKKREGKDALMNFLNRNSQVNL